MLSMSGLSFAPIAGPVMVYTANALEARALFQLSVFTGCDMWDMYTQYSVHSKIVKG